MIKVIKNSASLTYSLPSQRITAQHTHVTMVTHCYWPSSLDCNVTILHKPQGYRKGVYYILPSFRALGQEKSVSNVQGF